MRMEDLALYLLTESVQGNESLCRVSSSFEHHIVFDERCIMVLP